MPPESERLVERHAHAFAAEPGERSLSGAALGELSRAVLERGVSFRLRAMGGSMYPMIENGDVLTVAPLDRGALSLGDVVEFLHPGHGGLRVHRVVGRRNGACLVQGDGSDRAGRLDSARKHPGARDTDHPPGPPDPFRSGTRAVRDRAGKPVVLRCGKSRALSGAPPVPCCDDAGIGAGCDGAGLPRKERGPRGTAKEGSRHAAGA